MNSNNHNYRTFFSLAAFFAIATTLIALVLTHVNLVNAEDYTYDYLGRLTGVTNCDGSMISYTYDNAGNRSTMNVTAATRTLTVTNPNTAVTWTAGSNQTVTWTSSNVTTNVDIQLSRDGGLTWETLAANTPNDGNQSVFVSGAPTTQARIRVRGVGCGLLKDDSNVNFTLAANGADAVPPDTTITTTLPAVLCGQTTTSTSIRFDWSGTDNVTTTPFLQYHFRLDNGEWVVAGAAIAVTYPSLVTGSHLFEVRAIDLAGNVDATPAGCAFTIIPATNLPPVIASFIPTSGAPGTTVTITGANLAGATTVSFNGVAASFTINSPNTIIATVPFGAVTGALAVTTANGSGNSAATFSVLGTGSGGAACATASFSQPALYPLDYGSGSLVVADFNHDNFLDVAVANSNNFVTVKLGNGNGSFGGSVNYPVNLPHAIAAGDFNQDGNPDLVVSTDNSFGPGFIFVLPGNGAGGFGTAVTFPAASDTRSVAVADFNGDSKPDIVAGSFISSPGVVSVLLNTTSSGAFSFGPPTNFTVGGFPRGITTGDFNNDGKVDLATANDNFNNVSVLLGIGNGSFQPAVQYPTPFGPPTGVVVSDFNSDGKQDLAVANYNGTGISILLGNGNGTFATAAAYPSTGQAYKLAAGDFNNDGKPDLVVAMNNTSRVDIFLNNGLGVFTPSLSYSIGESPLDAGVGDFDRNGKLDVAATSGVGVLGIVLNNCVECSYGLTPASQNVGAGGGLVNVGVTTTNVCSWTAASNANWLTFSSGGGGTGNGTIVLSVAANTATTPRTGTITVGGQSASITQAGVCSYNLSATSLSAGFGAGSSTVTVTAPAGCAWTAMSTAGWVTISSGASGSGNGTVNLNIAANTGPPRSGTLAVAGQTVTVNQANGGACLTPSFGATTGYATNSLPRSIAVADYNNDGKLDLAVANYFSNNVSVRLGDGAGGFGAATDFSTGTNPWTVISRDFNGDGKADLAASNASSNNVSVLLGDGAGSFGAATQFVVGTTPDWITAGDFDNDGKLDLVTTNRTSNNISILRGVGAGSFGSATNIGLGADPFAVTTGDFNGDGKLDLAVAHYTTANNVSVLLGNGLGGFGAPVLYTADRFPRSIIARDLNGDGKLDLAIPNQETDNVSLLFGIGNGSFGATIQLTVGQDPADVVAGDFNADAKLDLAVSNSVAPGSISIMLGDGAGNFGAPLGYGVYDYPEGIVAGDFNGDGRLDLSSVNSTSNSLSLFLNVCNGGATITDITPASGISGTAVTITGIGFTGSTQVRFAGQVSAAFTVVNATTITTTVPAGAMTGPITVTTPIGAAMSAKDFAVIPCLFTLNPTTQNFIAGGGTGSVTVTASNAVCGWTATSNNGWITINFGSPGSGNGTINYAVAANNGQQRTGTMTIAGQIFTVTQASSCTFTINPTTQNFAAAGGGNSVGVTSGTGCTWVAASNDGWITINSGSPGSGNGTVNYTVVANTGPQRTGTMTIAGQTFTVNQAAVATTGLQFYPLAHPVRLLDTRAGQPGCDAPGAMIPGGTSRTQTAAGRTCDGLAIPANAKALTGNITTVQSGGGYLTLYPSDAAQPNVANSNYTPNQILNNVFTVGLGANDGAFKIFVTTNTNVVVDVTGYYAPPAVGGLYFHPLPKPIRLLETRQGQPGCQATNSQLQANSTRTQLGITTCDNVTIPAGAQALVGNATTVGPQTGGWLTFYPADAAQPLVASSNFLAGDVMNAPFTVGLSPSGEFKVFTTSTTDLVVDVVGYYSTQVHDVNGQGLLFNSLPAPVRLLDTRAGFAGCFTPGAPMTGGATYVQAATGACMNIPATAKAVVGSAAVVLPSGGGWLTFGPSSAPLPFVAASNYLTGQIFNRHFIVGLGADGAFKRYSFATTDLVIDLSGYFAP